MINKMNLTIAHKSSVDSMKKVLYTLSKEKYQVLESLTKQIINCDLISNELSKDYLKNFTNDKVKGNHDIYNEFVQILLKYNPKYLNNNTKEFMDDFRTKYSTKNHPKSKGLNYTISFPKSWIVKEGERPNIIINAHDQRNQNISLVLMTKEFMTKRVNLMQ
ncbi:MAG: hypothetical protein IPJ51_19720 [Saprospiraceae bacterium]|nr:hypothetical protein [Saprospiraceae bacterium]